ncbi:ATP-binding protein [Qipengyuania flava]|uniref:ATP-binding protein n=1 Tax=Qipengyuania flava TaxID=192812 RepID=A0A5P6N7F3_9SPHN|nr:AAA family ATPase [Qipengyuania flava]MAM55909.1 hypothetical protein [Salinicola sp.]QFI61868.1 ATP-binding protein [Qipengyuania flava]
MSAKDDQESYADGERNAVRGFSAQYLIAGSLIYEALLKDGLDWIRVADPDAGRLDDILVATTGRVDAYQVKWSEYEDRVTFNRLVADDGAYPSAFGLLAQGWQRLSSAYPDRGVHVHYLTRDSASSADSTGGEPARGPRHLQAFLRHAFEHRSQWTADPAPAFVEEWRAPIDRILEATGLEGDELDRFLAACHLDLGYELQLDGPGRVIARRREDVEAIAAVIQRTVASEANVVELSRDELLEALGWSRRFEFRFRHEFPVDEKLYRPVRSTIEQLEDAFAAFDSGYVALVGSPGSGKSTTLTQMLRYRTGVRIARYYAFVRGDVSQDRGEAEAFLHDLCISLEDQLGARGRDLASRPATMAELRERLGSILARLHDDWQRTGVKTIVLVDGLDHIEREQDPSRSLMEELPNPSSIPEGVLFVLGTQRVGLGSSSPAMRPIRAQLDEPGRTLTMSRLERSDVHSIVMSVLGEDLVTTGTVDRVCEVSGGHPLALSYLLRRLIELSSAEDIADVLDRSASYAGDIEQEYRVYWDTVSGDTQLVDLLALLCRLRGPAHKELLRSLSDPETLGRFVAGASHFFERETPDRWAFFHNSFRQFLLVETGKDAFGDHDVDLDRSRHRTLAGVAARAPATDPFSWERVHHLLQAGDDAGVLELFTQDYFRRQFFDLRPVDAILEDIDGCVAAASRSDDWIAVVRAVLVTQELTERREALTDVDLPGLLLRLAPREEMADILFEGNLLRVPPVTALTHVPDMIGGGDDVLARRVFDAAEPLDLLNAFGGIDASLQSDQLDAWVRVAWRFRSLGDIFDALRGIRIDTHASDFAPISADDDDTMAIRARARALRILGIELAHLGEFQLAEDVRTELGTLGEQVSLIDLARLDVAIVRSLIARGAPVEAARSAFERLRIDDPSPRDAVFLADLAYRLHDDPEEGRAFMRFAADPLRIGSFDRGKEDTLGPGTALLVQARNRARDANPMDAVEAVPNAESPRERGLVLFQRMLVVVGTIWGAALGGRRSPPSSVLRELRAPLTVFQRSFSETNDWRDWYAIQRRAPAYFENVLKAAWAQGQQAFDEVMTFLEGDFARPGQSMRPGWQAEWQIAVAMSAYRLDRNRDRTRRILDEVETQIDFETELHERIGELAALVRARLDIGDRERALQLRDRMMTTSFGIYHSDDSQMLRWSRWATRYSRTVDADEGRRALLPLISALPCQERLSRGHDVRGQTVELVSAAAAIDPAWASDVVAWLLQEGAAERSHAYAGLVHGIITRGDGPTDLALLVIARSIVPFEASVAPKLIEAVAHIRDEGPPASDGAPWQALARAADLKSTPGNRASWAPALGLTTAGSAGEMAERTRSAHRGLVGEDGTSIAREEVTASSGGPDDFIALLMRAAKADGVDWEDLLAGVVPSVRDARQLGAIRDQVARLGGDNAARQVLALGASRIGAGALMDDLHEEMLAGSERYGWVRRYDGGSRLRYARSLVECRGPEGRREASRLFAEDFIAGLAARDLLFSFDPILEILFDPVPVARLWPEFAEHFGQLAEVIENEEEPPVAAPSDHEDAASALLHLLFSDLASPILAVASEARRGIVDLVRIGCRVSEVEASIVALLAGDDFEVNRALDLLACIVEIDQAFVASYTDRLRELAWPPSATARAMILRLLARLGSSLPDPPEPTELPPIYRLSLPEAVMPERSLRGDGLAAGDPLPDTTDPMDLSSLFRSALKRIGEEADIPHENLAQRFASLMGQITPQEEWSFSAENELRHRLKAIGLQITFRRPRSLAAHRAFSRLVTELTDADVLSWPLAYLDRFLLTVDPVLDLCEPVARPEWVALPAADELGAHPMEEWLAGASAAASMLTRTTPDGGLVLAEFTTTQSIDHSRTSEVRASQIVHPGFPLGRPDALDMDWFHYRRDAFATDYPAVRIPPGAPFPTLVGDPYFTDGNFLAVNPVLATSLGWRLADEGLFRWIDAEGETMVESIRWQEGNRSLLGVYGYEESTSDGWLVVASAAATPRMLEFLPGFRRQLAAGRYRDRNLVPEVPPWTGMEELGPRSDDEHPGDRD